ncbi:MAG: hypothetical protein A3F72_02765 [Bacteroidetes bacterium RIFCSPLOWO2_12_FULL_35_15]|nr:MAG: hypothetical protein A3F72_02765 [Bacteroidetes bacterium RIFCSPLOWO2_12_FULL_35_15]
MGKQSQEKTLEILIEDFTKRRKTIQKSSVKKQMNYTMSLQERAKIGMEALKKQEPVTLSQARAQALLVELWSGSNNKQQNEAIKYNLRIYFPELSEVQINDGLIKIYNIYNEFAIK